MQFILKVRKFKEEHSTVCSNIHQEKCDLVRIRHLAELPCVTLSRSALSSPASIIQIRRHLSKLKSILNNF